MERRQLADRAVDEVRPVVVGVVEERDVGLHRQGGHGWEFIFGESAENGLAADHEYVAFLGDGRCGAQDVLQL